MPSPVNRRMPISCEPCRARKIRCPRNRSPQGNIGPCDTCIRRGIPLSDCIYLRQTIASRSAAEQASNGTSNEELLQRIRTLEGLVREQIITSGSQNAPSTIPIHGQPTPVSPHTEAERSQPLLDAESPLSLRPSLSSQCRETPYSAAGTLSISETGYVKYEPRASQWNSILENVPAAASVSHFKFAVGDAGRFAFTTSSSTRQDLLAALPPVPQCDELKDVYFQVFSPVWTAFYSLAPYHHLTLLSSYSIFSMTPPLIKTIYNLGEIQTQSLCHGWHCYMSSSV